jgi:predicted murein hydrolase (TIGR00659 family)
MNELWSVWTHLQGLPTLWLLVTLLAYQTALWLYKRLRQSPLANPVAVAVVLVLCVLLPSGVRYQEYATSVHVLQLLLGTATVALAVPLYHQLHHVRALRRVLVVGLIAGSCTGIVTALGVAWWLGGSEVLLRSVAAKSVTTPIAMGISERIDGLPSLTAAVVICTGVVGAMVGQRVFVVLGISDQRVCGFALGIAAHGIGTARALELSQEQGAFAALAMGLNGLLTALLVPVLIPVLLNWFGW